MAAGRGQKPTTSFFPAANQRGKKVIGKIIAG
jgi:hypothetical protein